jgi:hypothetical protein
MNEADQLASRWGVPIVVAILAIAVRMLLNADRWSLLGLVRGIVVGGAIGFLAALWVWDQQHVDLGFMEISDLSRGAKGVFIWVCAFLGENLAVALLAFGTKLEKDPLAFIDWIRGRK